MRTRSALGSLGSLGSSVASVAQGSPAGEEGEGASLAFGEAKWVLVDAAGMVVARLCSEVVGGWLLAFTG